MGIHIAEQIYDKKKNKLSVTFRLYFRVNFLKSVMFFENKIRNGASEETKKVYQDFFVPMIIKYLAKYEPRFVRPIPKIKKKLTKADKLQLQIEDMQTEHEDEILALKKDYEKQIVTLKQLLENSNEERAVLAQRIQIIAGALLVLVLLLILYSFI